MPRKSREKVSKSSVMVPPRDMWCSARPLHTVGVTTTGCSGHMYQVEYAEEQRPMEDVVEQDGVRVFIDPLALMFIFGSTMDYVESKINSGFVFDNPNVTGQCGCGESFSV